MTVLEHSDKKIAAAPELRTLVIERIRILEKELQHAGIDVRCGVELECFGLKNGKAQYIDLKTMDRLLKNLPCYQVSKLDVFTPSRKLKATGVSFLLCGLAGGTTMEMLASAGFIGGMVAAVGGAAALRGTMEYLSRQYEMEFSNRVDGKFLPLETLAESIHETQRRLRDSAKILGQDSINMSDPQKLGGNVLKLLSPVFAPSMHMNLSAWRDNKDLLSDKKVCDSCADAILDMQREGGLLMLSTRKSYEARVGMQMPKVLGRSYNRTLRLSERVHDGKHPYVESRMQSADCDPYLAVLASLGALYTGLVASGTIQNTEISKALARPRQKPDTHTTVPGIPAAVAKDQGWQYRDIPHLQPSLPHDMYDAYNRFNHSPLCQAVLGQELYAAVIDHYDRELSKDDIFTGPHLSR